MKCNEGIDFEADILEPFGWLVCPICKYKIYLSWGVDKEWRSV